ncbi:cation/H(+) antiporter 15-like [Quercus lobata]|nr:cation/H(+) antiporter 15-like [Quercus lobata]
MAQVVAPPNTTNDSLVCYAPTMITTNGIWQGDNPLDYSLPLFILQLTLIVVTTRALVFLLKPFRQPRVIAEILGGVLLGPSVLGNSVTFANTIFPLRSVMVIETMANVGLLYFLFLVGVEMDITVIRRTGKRALTIALAGMVLPFTIAIIFSFILHRNDTGMSQGTYILFLGVSVSVTSFPVLARILAELKLINTELGKMALSSALVSDVCAWILLALALALSENQNVTPLASLWVILSCISFVAFFIFVVRPAIIWMINRTPEGESFSDFHICLIITGVMISGFITDAIGTHSVFGAFVFGLIIPNGQLGVTLIEKLEDFVSGLLLPLFFAISGLKTNIGAIGGLRYWVFLMLIIFLSCVGKIAGTLLMSFFYQMPAREGITLGLLMNTKGLIEMIVLNVGREQKVLDDRLFAQLVIATVIMTGVVMPFVTSIYRPARSFTSYKRRTIQSSKEDAELRVLTCIHTPRNVPTIINLLEASHPTKKSPICVYVLHLVELTGRASAMLIVHNTRTSGKPALNRTQAQSDHIINAFENYEQHASGCVSIQPLTAISPYSTMHEDICDLAEDKRVGLIIIPFHKQQTVDGGMEATNPAFRTVNQNVLANAPCSVGILVDRGLNGSTVRLAANQVSHHIAVLFFGGPDDREALCYAWRMSQHPGISLTVLRFIPGEDANEPAVQSRSNHNDPRTLTIETDNEREKRLDEELINEFRRNTSNNESIVYTKEVVNNGEETVAVIRSMESIHDLFIVGRGQGMISPLTAGLTDWSECPELGAIGDMLASSDFAATVSVLVLQQYVGMGLQGDELPGSTTPDSTGHVNEQRDRRSMGQNAFSP